MREIRLYGHLGQRFGKVFKFDVKTPAEAVAALRANLDGFTQYLCKFSAPGYHVMVDKRGLSAEELAHPCGAGVIKIIPAVQGAKRAGVFQTILGFTLLVVGIMTQNPALIISGVAQMAGGIAQMLARPPKRDPGDDPRNRPNYAFNGPVNTTAQGNPVPVCYGELMVGSQVVSFGLSIGGSYLPDPYGNYGPGGPGSNQAGPGIPTEGVATTVASVEQQGEPTEWEYGNQPYGFFVQLSAGTLNNNWLYKLEWTSERPGENGIYEEMVYDGWRRGFFINGYGDAVIAKMQPGDAVYLTPAGINEGAPRWDTTRGSKFDHTPI